MPYVKLNVGIGHHKRNNKNVSFELLILVLSDTQIVKLMGTNLDPKLAFYIKNRFFFPDSVLFAL